MTDKTKTVHAFSGTHGTGKTTAVFTLASYLKRARAGSEIGIVREVARHCPYPIVDRKNDTVNELAQKWIFATQMATEIETRARYDIVICDRTVIDCIAYTMAGGLHDLAAVMMAMARQHMDIYDYIYVMRPFDAMETPADDGLRNLNNDLRKKVDAYLIEIYKKLRIKIKYGCEWA